MLWPNDDVIPYLQQIRRTGCTGCKRSRAAQVVLSAGRDGPSAAQVRTGNCPDATGTGKLQRVAESGGAPPDVDVFDDDDASDEPEDARTD